MICSLQKSAESVPGHLVKGLGTTRSTVRGRLVAKYAWSAWF